MVGVVEMGTVIVTVSVHIELPQGIVTVVVIVSHGTVDALPEDVVVREGAVDVPDTMAR